jgi:scyllo-inositol 2-dehydrogenase (NAD+)
LALIVDSNPEVARAAGLECGVPYHTDPLVALRDPAIEAVEICTASDSHAALISAAAAAGKAIFCEKPIALSLEDADAALATVAAAAVPLQIGHMRRFDPAYQEAKRIIDAGEIGRPFSFRSASLDGGISPSREFLARCGGIMVDVALHDFDLARWLMGDEVVEVHATGAVVLHETLREFNDVDIAVISLRFARGGIGVVQVSHTAVYGYDIATEVGGERGAVRAGELRYNDVWHYGPSGRVSHDTVPGFHERFAHAYLTELIDFVQAVREGVPPAMSGGNARAALAIAIAARTSLQEGRTVRLDEMMPRR